jgi:hypothetical protein
MNAPKWLAMVVALWVSSGCQQAPVTPAPLAPSPSTIPTVSPSLEITGVETYLGPPNPDPDYSKNMIIPPDADGGYTLAPSRQYTLNAEIEHGLRRPTSWEAVPGAVSYSVSASWTPTMQRGTGEYGFWVTFGFVTPPVSMAGSVNFVVHIAATADSLTANADVPIRLMP